MSEPEVIEKFVMVDDGDLGVEIHTDQQVIQILIDNQHGCCETWGFITTEDTLAEFQGAQLLSISLVDMDYRQHPLIKGARGREHMRYIEGYPDVDFCFVDVETSKGKLQFVLYNNRGTGYYGHTVKIVSHQLSLNTVL